MIPLPPPDFALNFAHDTVLVQDQPDLNIGGLPILEVGPQRAVIIRFPGLFVAAQGRRAERAWLVFDLDQARPTLPPKPLRMGRVGAPWIEGMSGRMGGEDSRGATWAKASASLNWPWAEAALAPAAASFDGAKLIVDNVADLVNAELESPTSAWGFRIEGDEVIRLKSADAPEGHPRLLVEWSGEPRPWASATAAVDGGQLRLSSPGAWRSGPQTGEGAVAPLLEPTQADEAAGARLATGQTVYGRGLTAAVQNPDDWAAAAELLNSVLIPFSRTPDAPSGPPIRLALAADPAGLAAPPAGWEAQVNDLLAAALGVPSLAAASPSGLRIPGFGIGWDRRQVSRLPSLATIPDMGWSSRSAGLMGLDFELPLSRFDLTLMMKAVSGRRPTDALNDAKAENGVFLRLFDATGRSVEEGSFSVHQVGLGGERRLLSEDLGRSGAVLLPVGESGMRLPKRPNDAWWLRADYDGPGGKESVWIPATRVYDEVWRGGAAPSLEVRLLAAGPGLDLTNAAALAAPEDSQGRFPSQLFGLWDGKPETSVVMEGQDAWLELDLGRDLGLSGFTMKLASLDAVEVAVMVRGTGDLMTDSLFWCLPMKPAQVLPPRGLNSAGQTEIKFSTGPVRGRYVRILLPQGGRLDIQEIGVYAVGRGTGSISSQLGPALASASTGT
jgi:hypothetical protein